jgi:hypothetical protein
MIFQGSPSVTVPNRGLHGTLRFYRHYFDIGAAAEPAGTASKGGNAQSPDCDFAGEIFLRRGVCQNAITRLIRGLRGDLAYHLGAHILEFILKLDFLSVAPLFLFFPAWGVPSGRIASDGGQNGGGSDAPRGSQRVLAGRGCCGAQTP